MSLEYAPRGLIGVLTPQANTTVEPELSVLLPPGIAMINARLTSPKPGMVDRLLDYLRDIEGAAAQFANAPLAAVAFACTGSSYYAGPAEEGAIVARMEAARGVPVVTAGQAVRDALRALSARRIGLVSPYPDELTRAAIGYWEAQGFEVARLSGSTLRDGAFHPIYAMDGAGAGAALEALDPAGLDAIVMLGTGMPTLQPILARGIRGGVPVLSCMLCLAWRSVEAVTEGRADAASLQGWLGGRSWRGRWQMRCEIPQDSTGPDIAKPESTGLRR
ncbi:maleate cis-trans isomerase family protein [Roseomonas populi]|uniref:Aspartate/glutamate racemase family protein n=1 Tax=Roseomonas populi TaxID=3121582 RepID=A0ABT1XAY4_9PROT|nr:aspartate/glutamate racemase family protein [Roseomonas pecuniae]MCR0985296.1 aspartate/glutamate racemase family protein [Roseomonas pecuniae]